MRNSIFLLLLVSASAFAKTSYDDFCFINFMEPAPERPLLPDRRSAQEVVRAIDNATRMFHQTHSNYETTSLIAAPDGDVNAAVLLQPEGVIQILENITSHLRFGQEISRGGYFNEDASVHHPRKGWIVEEARWLLSPVPEGLTWAKQNVKNVKLSSTLFPSAEFSQLVGRATAWGSIQKREVEVLRYHPSVVSYVPLTVYSKALINTGDNLPEFRVRLSAEEWVEKQRSIMTQSSMPVYRDVFPEKALEKVVSRIKSEVDEAVGSKTYWTLSIRTLGELPFPEMTQLVVKIDHPNVETAWLASLEFVDRYAQALVAKVPSLRDPAPDAIPMSYLFATHSASTIPRPAKPPKRN